MRTTIIVALLMTWASVAEAQRVRANICIDIPNAAINRTENPINMQELCENLRIRVRATSADWGTKQCVEYLTRVGSRIETQSDSSNREKKERVNVVQQEMGFFDRDWPEDSIFTRTYCGDTVVQAEFGEECDPPADGVCTDDCKNITP